VTVIANDGAGAGLHVTAYSFDDGANWQTENTKTFTTNTTVNVKVRDAVGNLSAATQVSIGNIDTQPPTATAVIYTPSITTNKSVTVQITLNEPVFQPSGRSGAATGTVFERTYSNNISTTVEFSDLVGNMGSTGIQITRIDTNNPSAKLTYTPTTSTSGNVTVTLVADKLIQQPLGRSGTAP
jgi:hypothetical protein